MHQVRACAEGRVLGDVSSPPLLLHTGTIKQLDLIHYSLPQETKAHNSAINCLQMLENCNSSWDDDDIAQFSRRRGFLGAHSYYWLYVLVI
jgi:hypothetical protein